MEQKAPRTESPKRLVRRGYLAEMLHATNRRCQLLSLTEPGRRALRQSFAALNQVATLVTGNLSAAERQQFFYLLHKFEAFRCALFVGAGQLRSPSCCNPFLPAPPEPSMP